MRDIVYISYSNTNREWQARLRTILDQDQRIQVWDDTQINSGVNYMQEIQRHVQRARIMIMLASEDYLSPNCGARDCEFLPALDMAARNELTILRVPIRRCDFSQSPLAHIKAAVFPLRWLEEMQQDEWQKTLENVYHQILTILGLPPRGFDVFLSHNSKDKPTVRQLGRELKARGLRVWLDEWELVPGRPWQEVLEEIIKTCQAAAVLFGPAGLGPWEEPEMRACLDQFVRRKLPVIPVLLPDAPTQPDLPLFLQQFTWVDLRSGLTSDQLDRLVWGITGTKPGVAVARAAAIRPMAPTPSATSLYPGEVQTTDTTHLAFPNLYLSEHWCGCLLYTP